MFPFNTKYGALINRNSNVTIACPSSVADAGIGNMGYYLALIGGFNFISKEVEPDIDETASYYLIADEATPPERATFLADLRRLAGKGNERWTIFVISSDRSCEESLHYVTRANAKTGRESTILDNGRFDALYDTASESIREKLGLVSERDKVYRAAGSTNVSVRIGGGVDTNTFTLRVSTDLAAWSPDYVAVCKALAEALNATVGNPDNAAPAELLKAVGLGYQQ